MSVPIWHQHSGAVPQEFTPRKLQDQLEDCGSETITIASWAAKTLESVIDQTHIRYV